MSEPETGTASFEIFRAADAKGLMELGCMTVEPYTPIQREGVNKAITAGYLDGEEVRVLTNLPGFSLTHAWLKVDYPLPLHSHDSDCLYYIIAGSIYLGTEMLGPRDTFFVPAGVPYSYKPGPEGVELLEFRHATQFNFLNLAKGAGFWEKAAETAASRHEEWQHAARPSLNADPSPA